MPDPRAAPAAFLNFAFPRASHTEMHLGVFTDAVLSEGLQDSEELRGLIPVKVHSELGELCK